MSVGGSGRYELATMSVNEAAESPNLFVAKYLNRYLTPGVRPVAVNVALKPSYVVC